MFFLDCVKLLNDVVFCSIGQNQRLKRVICKGDKVFFVEVNENFQVAISKTPLKGKFGKVVYLITIYLKNYDGTKKTRVLYADGFTVCTRENIKYNFSL
jgi:hypothetical protein